MPVSLGLSAPTGQKGVQFSHILTGNVGRVTSPYTEVGKL